MVLAAGLGQRMRPLTDNRPKPLVPFCGKPLIDHVLDRLEQNGVSKAVVNMHYFADQLEQHVKQRVGKPAIVVSDERDQLLDTGGGLARALPELGNKPFFTHNSDSVWIDASASDNLQTLMSQWNESAMDCLMLLADPKRTLGYDGPGDFVPVDNDQRLRRRTRDDDNAFVYTGVSIMHPRLCQDPPDGPFSMNWFWDIALREGRLFGSVLDGTWMHIGTPAALTAAETWVADDAQNR